MHNINTNSKFKSNDISLADSSILFSGTKQGKDYTKLWMTAIAKSWSRNYKNGIVWKSVDGWFKFPELYKNPRT